MKTHVLLIACALPIAACDRSPEISEKDASVAEVAEKVRQAGGDQSFVRPGMWQSKVTIEQFEVPGMPPEVAQRMKTMMAEQQAHDFETCLTPDEVKRPKEDFFAGKNNQCRYDSFNMGGGKIDAVMRCGDGKGATNVMQMAGTYSPESYNMQMAMKMAGGGQPEAGVSMRMRVEARRTGECTKDAQG